MKLITRYSLKHGEMKQDIVGDYIDYGDFTMVYNELKQEIEILKKKLVDANAGEKKQ